MISFALSLLVPQFTLASQAPSLEEIAREAFKKNGYAVRNIDIGMPEHPINLLAMAVAGLDEALGANPFKIPFTHGVVWYLDFTKESLKFREVYFDHKGETFNCYIAFRLQRKGGAYGAGVTVGNCEDEAGIKSDLVLDTTVTLTQTQTQDQTHTEHLPMNPDSRGSKGFEFSAPTREEMGLPEAD